MTSPLKVQRHELKFYINRSDYESARSILATLMDRDENQKDDRGYFIRSLYFDDVADTSVHEKLDGIETRDKYRLRIYDFDQDWAKLERKHKALQYVSKSSVFLTKQEAYEIMDGNYDVLLNKDGVSAKSIYFDMKRKFFRPMVIIDYIRDAFKLDYNDIRITFDKHIRASREHLDLYDRSVPTLPLQRDDVIIMEVKFNTCLPSWFKDFLQFDGAVNQAISKYCFGRMDTRDYYISEPYLTHTT